MTTPRFPIEQRFATGHQGLSLVLMVCEKWIWAGLYSSPHSRTPVEVSASPTSVVRTTDYLLRLGTGRYPMTAKSLQAACRWLDRHGVAVRQISPTSRAPRTRKGNTP